MDQNQCNVTLPPTTISAQSCPAQQFVTGFNTLGQVICSVSPIPFQDTFQDLAVANLFSRTISVLLGKGTGLFSDARNFPVNGIGSISAATGDFNNDTLIDLVVANRQSDTVSIVLGDVTAVWSSNRAFL